MYTFSNLLVKILISLQTAPPRFPRSSVQPLINASLSLATELRYKGLGTFEFLVNSQTSEWVFLEVNPRVQVEHTVTGAFFLAEPVLIVFFFF